LNRDRSGTAGLGALEPWALDLLRSARVGHLGTAGADGRPLVVPVCYALLEGGDTLQVVTAVDAKPKSGSQLRRLRNLEQNPQATLLVDVWDEDWARLRWVMVEGRADVLRQEDLRSRQRREVALRALETKYPQYRSLPLDPRTPVIALRADHGGAWRFASGSAPVPSG
jgi:PPOX class probable F420-dependent enzyme